MAFGRLGLAVGLLALLVARVHAEDGCTVDVKGSVATVVCTADVGSETADGTSWKEALAPLADATEASLQFSGVDFTQQSFLRFVQLAVASGQTPSVRTVDIEMSKCTMQGQEIGSMNMIVLPGNTTYSLTLKKCQFTGNSLNATALVSSEDGLDVKIRLEGTDVSENTFMAAGGLTVGGNVSLSATLTEKSRLDNNTAVLIGLLFASGDGSASVQLANSNVTGNTLNLLGTMGFGGNASVSLSKAADSAVVVADNEVDAKRLMVVQGQPLMESLVQIVIGVVYNNSGLDIASAVDEAQAELCLALTGGDVTALLGNMSSDAAAQLLPPATKLIGKLCNGSKPSSDFSLSSLAPSIEAALTVGTDANVELLTSVEGLFQGLLASNGTLEGLVGSLLNGTATVGSALSDVLAIVIASPQGNEAAGKIADLLERLGSWLETPLGGAGGNSTSSGGGGGGQQQDLGGIISAILGGADAAAGSDFGGLVQKLVDALSGKAGSATPEDILRKLLALMTGGQGQGSSVWENADLSGLVAILRAVVASPSARDQLPKLIPALLGGKFDLSSFAPVIAAVLADPAAAAALPSFLDLLKQMGVNIPGLGGR